MTSTQEGIEPELLQPIPRKVSYVGLWSAPIVNVSFSVGFAIVAAMVRATPTQWKNPAALIVLFGIAFLSISLVNARWRNKLKKIASYGVAVRGVVKKKEFEPGSRSVIMWVTYEFQTLEGINIQERKGVNQETWEHLQEGENATVLYVPKRPSENILYRNLKANIKVG